jgi:fumarate hydratase subunit alpha
MKSIKITEIKTELKNLLIKASFNLPEDIISAVKSAIRDETNENAKIRLNYILENEKIARSEILPLCQDCGTVYINLDIGPDICFEFNGNNGDDSNDGNEKDLNNAINQAVGEVFNKYYLRRSIVSDPLFDRKNTLTNTPAIINTNFVSTPGLGIEVNIKGGGSENGSYLFMLNPSSTEYNIIEKVLSVIKENVTKCCPPVIIGVGIGSTASEVVKLARKASFRELNVRNRDPRYAAFEQEILTKVNETGIGPQGLGGRTTALACNIEFAPCHMATLPLAVFMGCHSTRRAKKLIR